MRSISAFVSGLTLSLILAGASSSGLWAQAASSVQATPRITEAIDEAHRATLSGNVHPFAVARYDKGEAAVSTPTGSIQLVLRRSATQQHALTQYLSDVQNPHSASYHKWLTPDAFGKQFGVGDADLETLKTWLQGHGFKVERVAKARTTIQFSGSFGQVESAFHTSIHVFEVNDASHFANVSDPQIPAALKPVVAGVGPLHDFRPTSQAQYGGQARYDTSSRSIKPDLTLFTSTGTPYLYVNPADAATIYDTPNATLNANYTSTTYDGTGINIGIIGDSNITIGDVSNYRVAFLNETAATANLPTVIVDGVDPGINGDEGEALLDNEISGGLAPKAKLYLYVAANTDLQTGIFDALVRALDDNQVSILNLSFGGCEAGLGTAGNTFALEMMEQAAAQGISVTVSTGDNGSASCDNPNAETSAQYGLAVSGLASTPYNIAVGGTDYDVLPANFSMYAVDSSNGSEDSGAPPYYRTALSYIPEEPWNNSTETNSDLSSNSPLLNGGKTSIVAGSGGASSCISPTTTGDISSCQGGYAKPAFQSSLTPNDNSRDVPDVSFLAANGLYQAVWVVCSDSTANGSPAPYTDCITDNGAFTSATSFSGYGGTSAAAPTMAGVLALVEQKTGSRLGQADYVLYQLAQSKYNTVFHDVTEGNNSVVCASGSPNCGGNGFLTGYNAGTGYDQASGLGSVDVAQLVNNWSSVSLANTTTSLTINGTTGPINVVHGTALTFAASVSPTAATGSVSVIDNANETAGGVQNNGQTIIPLTGGSGTTIYNGLPGGSYTVNGYYAGDTSDAGSTSNGIPVTISAEDSTVATTVGLYAVNTTLVPVTTLTSVPYGSYAVIQAQIEGTVEGQNTQGIATGTVSVLDNGAALASNLPLNASNSVLYESSSNTSASTFALGAHSITATYAGDASYKASTSAPFNFTVVKGGTAIVFSAPSATISSLASTPLNVTVGTTSLGADPTGTLTLTANGATLATFTNLTPGYGNNGADGPYVVYSLQGSVLNAGANTITATYSGDSNYTGSTGNFTITVTQAGFTLANSGAITVEAGATTGNTSKITASPTNGFTGLVNLTCAVSTSPSGATSTPTCTVPTSVDIAAGSTSPSGSLTVTTTTSTTPGAYVVTVTGTDATTGKVTATTNVNLTVTGPTMPGSFSLTGSGAITVAPGATTGNTESITVTPANGFTGQVNLACAVTTSIASPVDPPTCALPTSVSITGSGTATGTLTVTTTAATSALNKPVRFGVAGGAGAVLAAILIFAVPRRRRLIPFALVLLALSAAWMTGCGGASSGGSGGGGTGGGGGGSTGGTSAGTYTVTVTGTDAATGTITSKATVSVTVN
ncbi:protease pro-enzyme activation domain-containing protein [Terracidiphilus gabretensis]|uniref:protease pro-enzyme activation domain-containing protein n=1 Tax=Terracidiphilus gabretensis TaxID=1577687 RepID=UPI0018D248EC|nr:protease pro-enzyme activation domain-containing protein [Terracidiphilus gabretensis]